MKIVLLGSPGVGKGTYADGIKKHFLIPQISTGDIFRSLAKKETELAKEVKAILDSGDLVPDETVIKVVKERLEEDDVKNGYILDGFPRTIAQAEALQEMENIDVVILFDAMPETIIQRLSGRRVCKTCGAIFHVTNIPPKVEGVCDQCGGELYQREDDKPEVIKERIEKYNKDTAPLIDYYTKVGILRTVDANSSDYKSIIENTIKVIESTNA